MHDKVFEKLKEIAKDSNVDQHGSVYWFGGRFFYSESERKFYYCPVLDKTELSLTEQQYDELSNIIMEKVLKKNSEDVESMYKTILSYGEPAPEFPKSQVITEGGNRFPMEAKISFGLMAAAVILFGLAVGFTIPILAVISLLLLGAAFAYIFPLKTTKE